MKAIINNCRVEGTPDEILKITSMYDNEIHESIFWKMSPTSKEVDIEWIEFYNNLTKIKTERNIDYYTLKRNVGKRVFQTDQWFVLAEDLAALGLKVLEGRGIKLISNDESDETK